MSKKKYKNPKSSLGEGIYMTDLSNEFDKIEQAKNPIVVEPTEVMSPDELFSDSGGDGLQNAAKELFNPKNPKIKSEFTDQEILIMSRLYVLSKRYYEPRGTILLKEALDELVLLRISKDRGSRKEFVETNREIQKGREGGFLGKLFGVNGGNNNI